MIPFFKNKKFLFISIFFSILFQLQGCNRPATPQQQRGLQAGDKLLDFSLMDANGQIYKFSNLPASWYLVIAFYRGSYCDTCRTILMNLKEDYPQFARLNTALVAISSDSIVESNNFNTQWQFPFPLLSDPSFKIIDAFGVRHPNGHGIYDVARPSIFIIDPLKVIRYKKIGKNPDDLPNGNEILFMIQQLKQGKAIKD
jgi:peroxiredoxin Q/BCP